MMEQAPRVYSVTGNGGPISHLSVVLSPPNRPRSLPPVPISGSYCLPKRENPSAFNGLNQAGIPPMASPTPMTRDIRRPGSKVGGPIEAMQQLEPKAWNETKCEFSRPAQPSVDPCPKPQIYGPYSFVTSTSPSLKSRSPRPHTYYDYTRGQFVRMHSPSSASSDRGLPTNQQPITSLPAPPDSMPLTENSIHTTCHSSLSPSSDLRYGTKHEKSLHETEYTKLAEVSHTPHVKFSPSVLYDASQDAQMTGTASGHMSDDDRNGHTRAGVLHPFSSADCTISGGEDSASYSPSDRTGAVEDNEVLTERIAYLEHILEETCRESKDALKRAHLSIRNLSKTLQEKEEDLAEVYRAEREMLAEKNSSDALLQNMVDRSSSLENDQICREEELNRAREELTSTQEMLRACEAEKNELVVHLNVLQEAQERTNGADVIARLDSAVSDSKAAWESAAGWRARSQAIEEEKQRLLDDAKKQAKVSKDSQTRLLKLVEDQTVLVRDFEHQKIRTSSVLVQFASFDTLRNQLMNVIDHVEGYISTDNSNKLESLLRG